MSEKPPMIYGQIAKIMEEIKPIAKDQRVESTYGPKFNFRGVDDVYNAVQPIMAKHRVFSTTEILEREHAIAETSNGKKQRHYRYLYRFRYFAEDGSFVDQYSVGEGLDTGDKAANKCAAIADKYSLIQLFKIPTSDRKDPDFEVHEIVNQRREGQGHQIKQRMPPKSAQRKYVLEWLKKQNLNAEGIDLDKLADNVRGKPAREWLEIMKKVYPDRFSDLPAADAGDAPRQAAAQSPSPHDPKPIADDAGQQD